MKNSNLLCRGIIVFVLIFFFACEDVSSYQKPPLTIDPSPEIIGQATPIPEQTPEQTAIPVLTEEPTPTTEPDPEQSPEPALLPEPTEEPGLEPSQIPDPTSEPTEEPTAAPEETPAGAIPTLFPGGVIITEIMYNPKSLDSGWEWIEVYNRTPDEIDVSGWVVDDGNKTPHLSANIVSGSIPAYGTGILFNSDVITSFEFEAAWSGSINLIPVTGWAGMGLNNTGDKIGLWENFSLYNGDHELYIHAVCTIEYADGSPWPVGDGAGSIYLTDISVDFTDGAQWALSIAGDITPLGTCVQSTEGETNSGADIGSP